jgi:hypothetical protein
MGDDHTPPGMIRLTTEIDRLTGDGSKTPTPSVLKPTRRRGATVSASDILTGKSDLQSIMKAVRAGQAAADDACRREAETVDRRLCGWGALRHALAAGTRRGRWWFHDFDGRTEAIHPDWWNSAAAEVAASHGVVTLTRAIGPNVHSLKAIVVIEEEQAPYTSENSAEYTDINQKTELKTQVQSIIKTRQSEKNVGGSPEKYPWEHARLATYAHFQDDLPALFSKGDHNARIEITNFATDWFTERCGKAPKRDQVNEKLSDQILRPLRDEYERDTENTSRKFNLKESG